MEEKQVDTANRIGLIFPGLISLAVGLMFAIPGLFFTKTIILRLIQSKPPDGIFVFVTILIETIGIILLLLAYQFFTGKVTGQHLSTPLLIIVSVFFIIISSIMAIIYIFSNMPHRIQTGRGIGGGFALGFLGLWFGLKRMRNSSGATDISQRKRIDDI